ncbi:ADP-ribosylglycohydrolase family protein [Streptomyces smaragdinus]|nr:ADP-ribosylglycohydrolase family protein [Streptomyces smaragdinus]
MTNTAWGRTEQQDFRSRVRGCLLGGAIGDALGASIEFDSLDAIRQKHGPSGLTDYAQAYGRRGAITDDTQMTLFTVDGLIRAQARRDLGAWHPPTDLHAAYRRWYTTQHNWGPDERDPETGWLAGEEWLYAQRAPGKACLSGLSDDRMGTLADPKNPDSKGCGAVMRSAPFGLLVGWEPHLVFQLAAECGAQTHGHPTGYLSAAAFAVLVHGVVRGESLPAATQRALSLLATRPGHEETTQALQRALAQVRVGVPAPERVAELGEGWVAEEALAMGLYCALVAEDVAHGLLLAVNHGGDSDSTGSITGNLLGALLGDTALPPAWLTELEGRGTILELADDFALETTHGSALHTADHVAPGWQARYPRT